MVSPVEVVAIPTPVRRASYSTVTTTLVAVPPWAGRSVSTTFSSIA
jgi:hypothetical protein